jgi:hypothetical protein
MWFVIFVGPNVYDWAARGKPFSFGILVNDCVFAVVAGWTATLSRQARGVAYLTWIAADLLMLFCCFKWERTVHLSPLADAVCDRVFVLFPLLVAVGAALLWRRRERIKEIQTMR